MEVGIIGLGRMGSAIARRLIEAGHHVTVYNRTRSRAETLKADGAAIADSPAGASTVEATITMLADDAAVEAVVFGNDGVLHGLTKKAVHISMSTITVAMSERLLTAHSAAEQRYLAAPVFGRPDALGGNFLIASMIECVGEAVALMRKSGVDPHRFIDIMTSSLFAAPVYRTYGELIVEQRCQPPGFAMPLGLKDIRSVLAAAETQRVPMPVASLLRDHFISGIARGGETLDWSALARVAAENAGL